MSKGQSILGWIARLAVAGILGQSLFFKFSAAPESIWIFGQLGAEPWGRIATGVLELVAALLILLPATVAWGALLAAGVMAGAIFSHLAVLGIAIQGDGGLLFGLAVAALVASLIVLFLHRGQLPFLAGGAA